MPQILTPFPPLSFFSVRRRLPAGPLLALLAGARPGAPRGLRPPRRAAEGRHHGGGGGWALQGGRGGGLLLHVALRTRVRQHQRGNAAAAADAAGSEGLRARDLCGEAVKQCRWDEVYITYGENMAIRAMKI